MARQSIYANGVDMAHEMITLITDVNPGEVDILRNISREDLHIRDLDGSTIFRMSPESGSWTHEYLEVIVTEVCKGGACESGADAFLGNTWVGSTEV